MKKFSKVLVLVLSAIMVLAMSASVFAADGDITVNGPVTGATYEAYLMFDVTVNAQNKPAYTIPEESTIANVEGFNTVFKTVSNGGKTYVQRQVVDGEEVTNEAIINWIKDNKDAIKTACGTAKASGTGEGSSITLATGGLGYYMIYSENGDTTAVSVDTTAKTATVNSKLPSVPDIPEDAKKVKVGDTEVTVTTMEVGQQADFSVTFNATNYAVEDGVATPITQYVVNDTPDGFTIDESTVAVKVNNADYAIPNKQVNATWTNGKLTVTIPWDQVTYPTPSTVVVTYKATLTNKNIAATSKNSAEVVYNEEPPIVIPPVYVYNYKVNVLKVEKGTTTGLPGAKFVLRNSDNKYYAVDANGKVSWGDQASATELTTGADGKGDISFQGLAAGTYYLVETQAPEGYTLAADKEVSLPAVTEKLESDTTLTVQSTVEDTAGTVLPGTGGIGTTIFYILGSLLVIGCGIVLVSRRRMQNNK